MKKNFLLWILILTFSAQANTFSIEEEIQKIKAGDFSSLILSSIFNEVTQMNMGYALCMGAGRSESDCDDALEN